MDPKEDMAPEATILDSIRLAHEVEQGGVSEEILTEVKVYGLD